MPANANDLMTAVASYIGRERSTFIRNGFDVLLQSCNNARLYAERMIDFELSRVSVAIPNVSLSDGGSLDDAVLFSDLSTPVSVKKIKKCFVAVLNSTTPFPVSFYSRDKWLRRVQRLWERNNPGLYVTPSSAQDYLNYAQEPAVIQMGRQVNLVPADARAFGDTVTLYFDVLQWLPQYGQEAVLGVASSTTAGKLVNTVGDFVNQAVKIGMVVQNVTDGTSATIAAVESGTTLLLNADIFVSGESYSILTADESDFLLDVAFDWMLYRSIWELNFFVKEDERTQLSSVLIADAWNALRSYNENLISQSVDDVDLD
jgi:hypothetical protein